MDHGPEENGSGLLNLMLELSKNKASKSVSFLDQQQVSKIIK